MIAASRQTLMANLVQQACAAAILLTLPNILSKADYASVVFAGMLLSFSAFADLGLSLVYGRVVPALHTTKASEQLEQWNATTLKFGLITSLPFAVAIAAIYFARFEHLSYALLLLPVPLIVFWFSFHVSRVSSTGDFREYRRSITWRALGGLVVIPLSYWIGLFGWFLGQLLAATLTLARLGSRLFSPIGRLDWHIIRLHWREGLTLACTTVLWVQLLNFARLYASATYDTETLATYGIISSAYQSVSMLVISVFLPVSVGILGRYGEGADLASKFAQQMLHRSMPWVIGLTLLGILAAPPLLHLCFAEYQFDATALNALLLCLLFHPVLMVCGNMLVASRSPLRYLTVMMAGLISGALIAPVADERYGASGAALGQLAAVTIYCWVLLAAARHSHRSSDSSLWRMAALYLTGATVVSACIMGISFAW